MCSKVKQHCLHGQSRWKNVYKPNHYLLYKVGNVRYSGFVQRGASVNWNNLLTNAFHCCKRVTSDFAAQNSMWWLPVWDLWKCYTATGSCKVESNKHMTKVSIQWIWTVLKFRSFFPSMTIPSMTNRFLELNSQIICV